MVSLNLAVAWMVCYMQLRQARGHMRRAQADATFARTNAILADEDVKRCQTIKQQIKQALEQVG
jgi:hypothetical protein